MENEQEILDKILGLKSRENKVKPDRYKDAKSSDVFQETLRRTLAEGLSHINEEGEGSEEETSISTSHKMLTEHHIKNDPPKVIENIIIPQMTEEQKHEVSEILNKPSIPENSPLISLEDEEKENKALGGSQTYIKRTHKLMIEGQHQPIGKWSEEKEDPKEGTNEVISTEDPLSVRYHEITSLLSQAGANNLTFSPSETYALERKLSQLGSLSIRDCIMFIEGYRSCGRVSEAKMAQMCDETNKIVELLKAQIRGLEVCTSSCKAQEKTYLDLLEQLKVAEREKISRVHAAEAEAIATIKERMKECEREIQETMASRIERKRATEREAKADKEREMKKQEEERLRRDKEQRIRVKTGKEAPHSHVQEDAYETQSESDDACTALLLITQDLNYSVSSFLSYYKISLEEVNKILSTWPDTAEELSEKYGSVRKAYLHLNTILRKKDEPK
ncbi:TPA_asm: protein 2 [Cupressus virus 1]|uniref:Protein 2 n=1 Tax=Cupressus virus 1 TaxID=2977965 RepID=A0A9N7AAM5_9RHAB|nr:TPA_asm: protein 2 [Cupressus virus 1]